LPYDRDVFSLRRRRPAPRPIGEVQAYARLHGERGGDVRIVKVEPRRPRFRLRVSGEDLRRGFELRLDARRVPREEGPGGFEPPTDEL
jgi:hypothetical protein